MLVVIGLSTYCVLKWKERIIADTLLPTEWHAIETMHTLIVYHNITAVTFLFLEECKQLIEVLT